MPRMLPDGRRLGAHLPLGGGMVKAVDRAARDRGQRAPDLRRQPDRLAPPRRAADRGGRVPGPARRARHRAGRHPRVVPRQPGRPGGGPLRAVRRGPRQRPARGARASRRGSSTSMSARTAAPGSPPGSRASRTASRLVLAEVDDGPCGGHARPRELAGQRVRARDERRRAGRHRRRGRRPGRRRASASGSASTRRTPGPPGSTSADPDAIDAFLADSTPGSGSSGW